MERPSSSCMATSWSEYSGFRTRAMVPLAPSFLAVRQVSRFSSSRLVAAMSRSAFSTPASRRVVMEAPLPVTAIMSSRSALSLRAWGLESMMVTSWPSEESWVARAAPTLPSPTMMMFIGPFLFVGELDVDIKPGYIIARFLFLARGIVGMG